MNILVQPAVSKSIVVNLEADDFAPPSSLEAAPPPAEPFDFEMATELAMKFLGAFELVSDLVKTAREDEANDESFLNNVGLVADTFADKTGELLDMLHKRTQLN